ncbi:MAG: glycerophosphodiester phosphodiesterase family protein [Myxococcota bacterium]
MRTEWLMLSFVLVGCAAPTKNQVKTPFTAINGPVIIAHRGGSLEKPENTIESVRHGIEVGADWVEVDVVLSKDDVPMVVHENDLERYAHVEGKVSEKTRAELEKIHVGAPGWSEGAKKAMSAVGVTPTEFGTAYPEATIPTLEAVLALGGRMMIEMKSTEEPQELADEVLEAVKNTFAYERVILGSFDPQLLKAVQLRDPTLPLVGILEDLEMIPEMLEYDPKVLAVRADLAVEARAQAPANVAIWVWTVYNEEMARQAVEAGVNGLITDAPSAVVKALRGPKDVYIRRASD